MWGGAIAWGLFVGVKEEKELSAFPPRGFSIIISISISIFFSFFLLVTP